MNRPMTFSPSVNDDGTYDIENGSISVGRGGGRVDAVYEENEMTGERQYLVEQSDLQTDLDYNPPTDAEYIQAITELYPDLQDALAYARDNKSPEYIIDFNNKIDGGDYGEFVPLIEELMEEYRSTAGSPVEEEQQTDEQQVSQEEINDAIEPMMEAEPEGMETAYEWLYAAKEYETSNPVYSAVCAATAAFHDGSMTAEEAISSVIENHPMNEVIKIYQQLSN